MTCPICSAELPETAMFCGVCGSSTRATPESRRRPDPRPADTTRFDRAALRASMRQSGVVSIDLDAVRPAPVRSEAGAPVLFALHFTDGQERTVFGTGLIGRRPHPHPGEHFDHLVSIEDPTRSVSKTHLEFGVHEGALWVADRFSGNGTTLHRPGHPARRCEPGRRYLVPRGSRVEMAAQSFRVA
ncbi:hypothetical protein [Agromyces archimandritae]|uniref:FHA domain-containing protein n=1 Tax=Agromyces archimandritae TaxID=2781962 RepID=A0A975IQK5_9MICO|nr:hypothetical protein [Agromyces archimandritae]QTX05136.1 hypothetical protein G127AT_02570 [Agromyces archimandritae]